MVKVITNMLRIFTWKDFDKSVEYIANQCKFYKFSGIYGIPRGGLCLAVALSHKLKVKLINEPIQNSLIVDDVFETGQTLDAFKNVDGAKYFVLFSKKNKMVAYSPFSDKKGMDSFPLGKPKNTNYEMNEYKNKRRFK